VILHITVTVLMWLGVFSVVTLVGNIDDSIFTLACLPLSLVLFILATGLTIQFFTTRAWRKRVENRLG
jgi:hypothetical protein